MLLENKVQEDELWDVRLKLNGVSVGTSFPEERMVQLTL
jgi:hypothetical protein